MERSAVWCDGGERARFWRLAWRLALPIWRRRVVCWLERRRLVAAALRDATEQRRHGGLGEHAAVELLGALSSGGSFYYHSALTASGVSPPVGPERGGTRVVVLGGSFRDSYTLRCGFGSGAAPVLARFVDENQLECIAPFHAPGVVKVLLSMNGQQYMDERRDVRVPIGAERELRVHADHGARRRLLVCVGGARSAHLPDRQRGAPRGVGERVGARLQRDARDGGGLSRVEVSNNAREYTSSGVRIKLVSVRVLDVQPWSGPVGGATVVSVRAHGAWPGGLRCRFGDGASSAGWSGGASRLRCVTPPSGAGVSGLGERAAVELLGALSSGGSFYYHAPLTASGASPPLGPERGGTRVVRARRRLPRRVHAALRVWLGAAPVLARYVDESQLECTSPFHASGSAAVLLSMNGQQYAPSGASYTYQPAASGELRLAVARARGGRHAGDGARRRLLVVVGGARRAACRIGGAVRRAVWASASALVCNATRARRASTRVEVSNNAREYTSSGVRGCGWCRCACSTCSRGAVRGRRDGGERARAARAAWRRALPIWRGASSAGWSGGASRLRCVTPPSGGGVSGLGGRAAVELLRRALERRQLLLPRGADGERRGAAARARARRHAREVLGGGFRDAYTLRARFGSGRRRRCSRGTSTSRSSSARAATSRARVGRGGRAALDERSAVRA